MPPHLPGPARDHRGAATAPRAPPAPGVDPGPAHRRARDDRVNRERVPVRLLPPALRGRAREPAAVRHRLGRRTATSIRCSPRTWSSPTTSPRTSRSGCTCRSSAPRTSRSSRPPTSPRPGARSSAARWWTISCRVQDWPRGSVPADYYTPVSSDVPALVLSARHRSGHAAAPCRGVAATLPHARHFTAPQLGHGVSMHGCAPHLIEEFVRKGTAEGLDGSCLERIPRPLFVLPLGISP